MIYSLRKYLRLALAGNPTVLLPLYAPASDLVVITTLGEELRALAPALLSQRAVRRFLGYLDSQRRRAAGEGPGRRAPARPELVARYGYDVKYASHALRLAYQGLEVAREGRLTLPMPAAERERVLAVKRGDVAELAAVLDEIGRVQRQIEDLLAAGRTPLPEAPDLRPVEDWSVSAHRRSWGWA